MGSSQSQVQVTNQITHINASGGSKVSSLDNKEAKSELEQLLQQISPLLIVALTILLLFSFGFNVYLCIKLRKVRNGAKLRSRRGANDFKVDIQSLLGQVGNQRGEQNANNVVGPRIGFEVP